MASFDQATWQDRAKRRFERASNGSTKVRDKAKDQFERDTKAIYTLQTLVNWCKEHSIIVEFKRIGDGMFDPDKNTIFIGGRAMPETQVGWLLHECGHWLVDNSPSRRVRCGVQNEVQPDDERNLITRVDIVNEEFDAWRRGGNLAKRLKLKINKERFERQKASALVTYMRWAART